MSEFTAGALFLNRDREVVEANLNAGGLEYILRGLNDNWSVFFLEDEFLYQPETVEQLRHVSQVTPILYFQNGGDHGWAYDFYDQGEVVASVAVSYETEFYMTQWWAEQRYPNIDVIGELLVSRDPEGQATWNAIRDEVLASDEYKQTQLNQFAKANVDAFLRFGLSDEQITALRNLLTVSYQETNPLEQVDEFKKWLGIEEMQWMSYRYAD